MTFIEQDRRIRRTRTMRLAAALMLGTAASAVAVAPAHAQQSNASLRGTITTDSGVTVTSVAAVEVATNIRRNATLSAGGTYNLPSLRAGEYRLEIVLSSGPRSTDAFTLSVAQNAQLDFDFSEGGIDAAPAAGAAGDTTEADLGAEGGDVVVTGTRLRELQGGEVGVVISQRLIDQLPQNNRNFLAFADLAPGVQFVTGAGGDSRLQGGAQDSRTVNVFIDGVGQKDYVLKNGITGQDSSQGNPFPQLAVGEYRVISSNYQAEFDQVSSVAITAVTKSGTNRFEGEAFIDFSNQDLRARRPNEIFGTNPTAKLETRDFQFGGALGGPIIRDTLFFYATYEGKRNIVPVDIFPGSGRDPSAFPEPYRSQFGGTTRDFNEDLYFGKLSLSPSSRDLFELSGKYRKETGVSLGSGTATALTATETDTKDLRATARWEHTGNAWVNDLKLNYEDVKWAPTPRSFEIGQEFLDERQTGTNSAGQPIVARDYLFRTGGGSNFQDKGQRGWTVQNDFTFTGFEGHVLKAGIKAKWVTLNSRQQNFFNPLYRYNTNFNVAPGGFNDQIPYRVTFGAPGAFGDANVNSDNFQFGVYAQDEWDVTDRLTLNLGIRWDYERTPSYEDFVHPQDIVDLVTGVTVGANGQPLYPNIARSNIDMSRYISTGSERKPFLGAFAPRLGFSYQLDEAGRFTVFGGAGRSYDRNQFDFLQQEVSIAAFPVREFNFSGDPLNSCSGVNCIAWNPIYLTSEGLQQLANSSPGGGRQLRFINNDLKVPYSDQFSIGVRGRFNALTAEVGYSYVRSRDGFAYLLANRRRNGSFFFDPAFPNEVPGSPFGANFTPPGFGNVLLGENGLETDANSVYLKLTKAYSEASPWSLDATYTYTDASENRQFGETFSFDYPTIEDYPTLRSSGVPRHRFVAAGSVDLPIGVSLSAKFQIQSPVYLKAFLPIDPATLERELVGREMDSLGDRWGRRQLDIAATKYFDFPWLSDRSRLRIRADIINFMNDRNYTDFNNNPIDNTRTPASPTIYGERTGFGVGGNPPRTIKLSAGFSF